MRIYEQYVLLQQLIKGKIDQLGHIFLVEQVLIQRDVQESELNIMMDQLTNWNNSCKQLITIYTENNIYLKQFRLDQQNEVKKIQEDLDKNKILAKVR